MVLDPTYSDLQQGSVAFQGDSTGESVEGVDDRGKKKSRRSSQKMLEGFIGIPVVRSALK